MQPAHWLMLLLQWPAQWLMLRQWHGCNCSATDPLAALLLLLPPGRFQRLLLLRLSQQATRVTPALSPAAGCSHYRHGSQAAIRDRHDARHWRRSRHDHTSPRSKWCNGCLQRASLASLWLQVD